MTRNSPTEFGCHSTRKAITARSTRLESKVIVITGGNSDIGRAVAERIASEGAIVVLGARRKDLGEKVPRGEVPDVVTGAAWGRSPRCSGVA
ncbi:SDR family NAD(P)-dependent oxidoreductase [Streptomyces zagrosensis]|uniref:SDR family NAD(P)-dependent oxidoreductase n=1 Tax=Streptomyces zagrosensis TaxID=1042984 RepID=UPI00161BFA59|nr:SDR family NAD(P)-dependent oxidoreductase [Streptomyces zagrosensis]